MGILYSCEYYEDEIDMPVIKLHSYTNCNTDSIANNVICEDTENLNDYSLQSSALWRVMFGK